MNASLIAAFVAALASVAVVLIANRGKFSASQTETATVLNGQLFTQLTALTEEARKLRDELTVTREKLLQLTDELYAAKRTNTGAGEEIVELKEDIRTLTAQAAQLKLSNDEMTRLIGQHWVKS